MEGGLPPHHGWLVSRKCARGCDKCFRGGASDRKRWVEWAGRRECVERTVARVVGQDVPAAGTVGRACART